MSDENDNENEGGESGNGFLRKITASTVCGKIEKTDKPQRLCLIYGTANRVKTGTSQFGPWVQLVGQFEAVNLATGQVFTSPYCILPDKVVNEVIAGAIESGQTGVEFAYEFGIKPSKSPVGYDYTAKPIVKEQDNDALASLRAKIPQALLAPVRPALAAPNKGKK